MLATGTISNAAHGTASLIDTYIEATETMAVALEHQVLLQDGEEVYLQLAANESSNHVMARVRIERL